MICQGCCADLDDSEIYVTYGARREYFCIDCLCRNEMSKAVTGSTAEKYLKEHEGDFSEWLRGNTETYDEAFKEAQYND